MAVRILAIDDDVDVRNLLEIKLGKAGFQIFTAANGEEGLAMALEEKPDVIVADVMMPIMDGHQVLAHIREKLGDETPITILLSALGQEMDVIKGLGAGADDYIIKPFSPRELIERIRVALIKRGKATPNGLPPA